MSVKNFVLNNKLIGQLMFLVLFILAIIFYLERTIFVDPCYAVFNILYYCDYISEAGRYAAVIPQTLALLAIKMNLPLKVILGIYSFSFILLYYLIFLVIAYVFKLDRIALAVPLVLLLGVKYSFFWISTETHQALVYTILFYSFLTWSLTFRPGIVTSLIRLIFATGILLLCFYSHPVSLFTVLFVLGFFVTDNKLWLKPDGYILGAVIIILSIIKFMNGVSTGYESFYFKGFGAFFERFGYILGSESLKFLKDQILNIYLFPLILFLGTTAWYIVMKQYLKLAYYLVSLTLFAIILFTTFDIWYYPFIQEKNLMGLNIFILIPFLKDVIFTTKKKKLIAQGFLILALIFAGFHIIIASFFYKDRLAYINNLINSARRYPEKKFIISETMVDRDRLNVNWALATETLMLSSLEGPDSSVSIYINDQYGKIKEGANLNDSLLFICAPWAKELDIRRLNKRYFNLEHSAYRILSENDLVMGNEIPFYSNRFDDPSFRTDKERCLTDSSGNSFFELKSEFSPGFYGKYSDLSKRPSIMITASVRVFPFEKLNSKWLNLVITREQNQVVFDYHNSWIQKQDTLKMNQWNTLTVSGLVRSKNSNDQLKVYLWNPEKKRVGMDDFQINYRTVDQ
ncbi:MAG: hypothetical protein WCP32_13280 [Bacteroidota bacterium]